MTGMQVRRLTPVECARLQAVPDTHLDILHRGKPLAAEPGMKQQCYIAVGLDEEQNATVDGMGCLKARREGGGFEGSVMTPAMRVRRLLPVECARLQSVPDTHLDILYRGKPLADGPKYKLLGNGFCINVVKWIGERIQQVENLHNR
jgi:site-specific DNA-cytosine methylase